MNRQSVHYKSIKIMNVLAILKDFIIRCKSVFENTTTKMSKRFLNWLILTIRTVALIPGQLISEVSGHTGSLSPAQTWQKENVWGESGFLQP